MEHVMRAVLSRFIQKSCGKHFACFQIHQLEEKC